MSGTEIERKWLVKNLPNLSECKFDDIEQGYLSFAGFENNSENNEVRIRKKSNNYYLTIKSIRDQDLTNIKRLETEIPLSKEQYDLLWPITLGKRIEKRRYYLHYQDKTVELDLYKAPLEDLIMAEVEFYSETEASKFIPPAWFDIEVTSDDKYTNAKLVFAFLQKLK